MNLKEIVKSLTEYEFVHSIILFGSQVRGDGGDESDIDICVISDYNHSVGIKDKVKLLTELPKIIDLCFYDDLPIDIRHRMFAEGKILYTRDLFHVLTLLKETDFKYPQFKSFKEERHRTAMERVKSENKRKIDVDRIRDKLDELEVYLQELKEDLPEDADMYVRDRVLRRSCEKTFELACLSLIDVCNLIISQKGFEKPKDNRSSIQRLVENNLINRVLGERLKEMIGFRNLLVHRYSIIDDEKAYEHLSTELGDFFEFIELIDSFLEKELASKVPRLKVKLS